MSLEEFTQSMLPAVEIELHTSVDQIGKNEPSSTRYALLRHMLAYHMGWEGAGAGPEARGKRIRPLLVLLSASAAGGDWKCALPAAAAVELLHNFSLIHDDIQDQSRTRRGRETVWVKWGAAQAINAGDLMFTLAQAALLRLCEEISPQTTLRAAQIFQDTCVYLTQGQYLDMRYESQPDLSLDDYWPMVAGKTAALLSACTQIGALAGGAGEDALEAYRQFGEALGLAFQVQDDWLGIWGDSARTGKSTESDLVTGKKTLPVLYALEKGGKFATRWQQGPVRPEEVIGLARLLAEEGAQEYTQQTSDRLTRQAHLALSATGHASHPASCALGELADKLLGRKG